MPTYTDKNGNTRTAVLDTAKSEGWVDNGDGTVSKTFTADANGNPAAYHQEFMAKIKNTSYLYLKFPDLVLEKDQTLKDVLSKDLTNSGSIVGIPANRGEGEPDITAEDSLIFRLTSRDLEGAGSFAKKQMVMSMIQLNTRQQTINGSSLLIIKLLRHKRILFSMMRQWTLG